MQTLLGYLNLEKGQAHRALDDSIACLNVTLKCFEKLGPEITIGDIFKIQLKKLNWLDYSIQDLHKKEPWKNIIEAIHRKSNLFMTYQGGSKPGTEREVCPKGIVRSPNGDFLVAMAQGEKIAKRYFLDKITAARL